MPAMKRFGHAMLCLVVSISIKTLLVAPEYTYSQEFVDDPRGFFFKAIFLMLTMHDVIFKFYTAFCFLEVLNIASGLGFVKENGQIVTYNSERSICIYGTETSYDM